ncbi:calcium/proton exchanger [Exophiala spinifera]|uniref:Calcium/proton exchanger n=1 Tax=Exophiala spinifera TaxID=91928 RepID=A0A0D2B771_9EURO|nr:calcium/proton exchanger [Exophiala spinifera]KIW14783.1 calcium/proton exchanger [Exophiala spinifera]
MHKFRREAKHAAWYSDDGPRRNPFGRWRPPDRANTLQSVSPGSAAPLRIVQTDHSNHYRRSSGQSHAILPASERPSHGIAPSTLEASHTEAEIQRTSSPEHYFSEHEERTDNPANPETPAVQEIDPEKPGVRESPSPSSKVENQDEEGGGEPSTDILHPRRAAQKLNPDSQLQKEADKEKESDHHNGREEAVQVFSTWSQIRATVFGSWINVLFLLVPVGFALNYANVDAAAVFAINFVAIIPSTLMISFAVDQITFRLGELQGALLSITFSNATQLISSVLLLKHKQMTILKTSLLGSIISNLLFMTGLCFFFGGINRIEQTFNVTVAQTVSMMLLLAVISLVVPTASRLMVAGITDHDIVVQSRGTSIMILVSYALYLLFQLKMHRRLFDKPSERPRKVAIKKSTRVVVPDKLRPSPPVAAARREQIEDSPEDEYREEEDGGGNDDDDDDDDVEAEEEETPVLSFLAAFVTLIVSTVLVAFNADFAIGSVQKMVRQAGVSQTFVGFVIFPLLSNDPESIFLAARNKLYLSISLTLDKCMQVALLIVPLLVMIAWAMANEEMTLDFDGFPVVVSFAFVIVVAYVVQEGKSNWLTGALLVKVYVIVALATYCVR